MKAKQITALLLAAAMGLSLAACGTTTDTNSASDTAAEADTTAEMSANDQSGSASIGADENATTYECSDDEAHAIEADGEEAAYDDITVNKTGEADGDEADFYGTNAAVFATNGADLTISHATIETSGSHANAVFSYGEGTTLTISDSKIHTDENNSGGIMVTGGGTLYANNLDIHTEGGSSAAIRSDRGGGTMVVEGGTYQADGSGSPAIYSTADITVNDAILSGTTAQAVVVEGGNSVTLNNCETTGDNTSKNSDKSDYYQAVMLYQSMSGDASNGGSTFTAEGGTLTSLNGGMFFVTNTVATINLTDVELGYASDDLLRICAAGWGNDGSNGGHVTLNASSQSLEGVITVDDISELNLVLTDDSTFTGSIDNEGTVYVSLSGGSKWVLTADTSIDYLNCEADSIDLNGYTLTVGGEAYEEGTVMVDDEIDMSAALSDSNGAMGGSMGKPGDDSKPGDGSKPDGDGSGSGNSDSGTTPPEKPSNDSSGSGSK